MPHKNSKQSKNKLDVANEEIRFNHNEENGLITVSHPQKSNSEKIPMKEVLKKMYHEEGGY